MANGQVTTGFSKPYVAVYASEDGTVTYSDGQILARGVEVSIEPETSDDNNFYADNIVGETAAGAFTGGTVTLTVDGLFIAAERLIMGLPAAGEDGWTAYGENQQIPYIGVGFIRRVMSGGVTSYIPYVLPKVAFSQISTEAATQEEEIDWQTQELSATIMRDDTTNQNWKWVGAAVASEALAEAALQTKLGIQAEASQDNG